MKKIHYAGALAIALATATSPALARDTIVAATWLPPSHTFTENLYTYWAEKVVEYSNGTLTPQVELGSPRVTASGNLSEIADGLADVSGHFAQYTPSDLPVANAVEELGMTFGDPRVMIAAATDFNMNDPQQQAEWLSKGVIYGSSYTTHMYVLVCNAPIVTLEDFKGSKIRLPGRAPAEWANSAGAATVSLSSNEQYGALDKGALTCTTTTPSDAYQRKLHEVATHITDLPITLFWAGLGHGYNQQTWSELTEDQRRAMLSAEADAMAALMVKGTLEADTRDRAKLAEAGVAFHTPGDDLIASLEAFKAAQPEKAVPVITETFGVADPAALLTRFQAAVSKWEALLADIEVDDVDAFAAIMRKEIYDKIDVASYGLN